MISARQNGSVAQETSQWGVLNGLRFFLAFVVLTGHISSFVNGRDDWTHAGLSINQGSAVFGFFVIDGFACADRLSREPSTYFNWRFYRIYPVFLANLLLVLAAYYAIGTDFRYPQGQLIQMPTVAEVLGTLVMAQQFLTLIVPLNGQTWSVACFWWLGILAPQLRRVRTGPLLCLMAASYVTFLIFQHWMPVGMHVWTYGRAFLGVSWIWLSGFMWQRLRNTALGVCLLIVPATVAAAAGYFIGLPLLLTLVILMLSDRVKLGIAATAALVWSGDLAFPLYLSHTPVVAFLCNLRITNSLALTAACLAVSAIVVHCVDYPARRWLSRREAVAAFESSFVAAAFATGRKLERSHDRGVQVDRLS
jgi:peptidoglycan/LPS O-acetylase OafA/YrhL